MTNKTTILMIVAVMLVAAALADAGCIGAIRGFTNPATPTPTPIPVTPTPLPTAAPTPVSTPAPTAPVHVDILSTTPVEAGVNQTFPIHVLTGKITYNGNPAEGYAVIVDTTAWCEYGNKTDANGQFSVTFSDDGSPTYIMKVANPSQSIIYMDKVPRAVNQTGPLDIKIDVPSTNHISVSITP